MIAKAGLGLIGLGAISIGGVAVTKPHWLGMDYMPDCHSLAEDHDFASSSSDYGTGKFGNKYKNYLVGVNNKESGKDDTSNKSWWEWAYRKLQKDEDKVKSGKFKITKGQDQKVNKPYSKDTNDDKALNNVCKEAYKANLTDVTDTGDNGNKFKKSEVWKYCSPLGQEPSTLNKVENKSEDNRRAKYTDNTKFGKSKEDKLVSIDDPSNNKFWEIRDKEFKEEGANSLTNGDTDSYFVKNKASKTIKELCEYVYGQASSTNADTGKIEETKVLKYCSFDSSSGQ